MNARKNNKNSEIQPFRFVINGDKFKFSNCGLDINRNFLEAPPCPCGCGAKGNVLFEDKQDVVDTCADLLADTDCDQCGIFTIYLDGEIEFVFKTANQNGEIVFDAYRLEPKIGYANYSVIGDLAIETKLHLYGLMVEVEDGQYSIIEE